MSEDEWVIDPVTQVELRVPTYATSESAIRRAALQREGRLRVIRLYPEWTNEWPVWEDGTDISDPDAFGLSPELRGMLRKWQDVWETHFVLGRGWPTVAAYEGWAREGDVIAERLEREVWEFAEVRAQHRMYSKVSPS